MGVSGGGHIMSVMSSSQYSLNLSYRYLRHSMLLLAGGIIPLGGGGANCPSSKK